MLFRQLAHRSSSSFTYLVGSRRGGEALLIDPVLDELELYVRLIEALDLRLVFALDTHVHGDRPSALAALRGCTQCVTAMGEQTRAECVALPVSDGEVMDMDGVKIEVMYTPGHTADSYSFVLDDRVFTGDTLLIGGTGRTDQGGDSRQQYESLFGKLLQLPGRTLVYPAHDYRGRHVSSIEEERRTNPRLQVRSLDEYAALMDAVRPSDAALMDVVEQPGLRRSSPLLRELTRLKALLAPPSPTRPVVPPAPPREEHPPVSGTRARIEALPPRAAAAAE